MEGKLFRGFHDRAPLPNFHDAFGTVSASGWLSALIADSSRPLHGHAARHRTSLLVRSMGDVMSTATATVSNWDRKAEQARAKAMTMISPEAKALMLGVARKYKQLALASRKPRKTTKH